jgi:hypothetical protein
MGERDKPLPPAVMAGLVPAIPPNASAFGDVVHPHCRFALLSGCATQLSASCASKRVDGRDKPGHDGKGASNPRLYL